jgi:hypothetical protein
VEAVRLSLPEVVDDHVDEPGTQRSAVLFLLVLHLMLLVRLTVDERVELFS